MVQVVPMVKHRIWRLCTFNNDGERFEVESGDEGLEIFVLSGEPLNEPVVKQGPYVMTNKTELLLAYGEYINGKFGREEAIM